MTLYMPLFRSCTTLRTLTQLHAHLLVTGLHSDPPASSRLIESYARMGTLQSSRLVFETFTKPDSFMWAVLIKCYVWNNLFEEAISLYHKMICNHGPISNFIYPSVLRACSGSGDLVIGGKVHGRIIKCGFDNDDVVETSLVCLYGEIGCLDDARKMFDKMSMKDVVSWSSIIKCCVNNGKVDEGLEILRLMIIEGLQPDYVTMLSVAEACGELCFLRLASSVHGHVLRRKIKIDGPLSNSLVVMYSKCNDLSSAEKVFFTLKKRCTTSWTAMISCYNRSGCFRKALDVFVRMLEVRAEPNSVTLLSILGSCAGLAWLREGKSVHCHIIRKDMESKSDFLGPALIDFYAACGELRKCEKVLRILGEGNIISWNKLMSEYAHKRLLKEALAVFAQMQAQGRVVVTQSFDSVSSFYEWCVEVMEWKYPLLLPSLHQRSCTTLRTLTQLHAHLLVTGLHSDPPASSRLIESYARMGTLQSSRLVFETFTKPDSFMWAVLIKCYVWNNLFEETISLYHKMIYNHGLISNFIYPSVLRACSGSGNLVIGGKVHGRIIKCGFDNYDVVETSLADVVSWSSIIKCCVNNGKVDEGLEIFRLMIIEGVQPDYVTMLSVAKACGELCFLRLASSVHGHALRKKIEIDGPLGNSLIVMYSECNDLSSAEKVFVTLKKRCTTSWTAMISCYNRSGCFRKALDVFVRMLEVRAKPNSVTRSTILERIVEGGIGSLCTDAGTGSNAKLI
ncbi:hypothetical protein Pint_23545 [Pistacia integerrima]|uniref:Uncharacterized protein n=1 Tax=Pistacia integerrima TaxID=434235 RepID=A0ACC0YHB9_9ROSI|nr:hypothetical protein Pint_23545 [Pistacia integerrima]